MRGGLPLRANDASLLSRSGLNLHVLQIYNFETLKKNEIGKTRKTGSGGIRIPTLAIYRAKFSTNNRKSGEPNVTDIGLNISLRSKKRLNPPWMRVLNIVVVCRHP